MDDRQLLNVRQTQRRQLRFMLCEPVEVLQRPESLVTEQKAFQRVQEEKVRAAAEQDALEDKTMLRRALIQAA